MAIELDVAYVSIVASGRDFDASFRRAISGANIAGPSRQLGEQVGAGIGQGVRDSERGLSASAAAALGAGAAAAGREAGEEAGDGMGDGLRRNRRPTEEEGRRQGRGMGRGFRAGLQTAGRTMFAPIATAATAAFASMGIGSILADSISEASDLSEAANVIDVTFGEAADQVNNFAATAAKQLGSSRNETLAAAGVFGTFGKSAGLAGTDLAKFSTDFVTLAGDLASFNNTTPEQAIEAIGAALRGETEPIRAYGVMLDDASLRQEALALGLIKTTKEALTPQQKVLAAQAAIYRQTSDAQGDFQRTSDGLANQQRILSAAFKDLKADMGKGLLPIMTSLVTGINTNVLPALKSFGTMLAENKDIIAGVAAGLAAGAAAFGIWKGATLLAASASTIAAGATTALGAAVAFVTSPITLTVAAIALLTAGLVILWKRNEAFRNFVKGAWAGIKQAMAGAVDFVMPKLQTFGSWLGASFTPMLKAVGDGAVNMSREFMAGLGQLGDTAVRVFRQDIMPAAKMTGDALVSMWRVIRPPLEFMGRILIDIGKIAATQFVNNVKGSLTVVGAAAKFLWPFFKQLGTIAVASLRGIVVAAGALVKGVGWAFKAVADGLGFLKKTFEDQGAAIGRIFKGVVTLLRGIVDSDWRTMWAGAQEIVRGFVDLLKADFGAAVNAIADFGKKAGKWLGDVWKSTVDGARTGATWLKDACVDAFSAMSNAVQSGVSASVRWLQDTWRAAVDGAGRVVDGMVSAVKAGFDAVTGAVRAGVDAAAAFLRGTWVAIFKAAGVEPETLQRVVAAAWDGVKTFVGNGVAAVKALLAGDWRGALAAAGENAKLFLGVIREAFGLVSSVVGAAIREAIGWLQGQWKQALDTAGAIVGVFRAAVQAGFDAVKTVVQTAVSVAAGVLTGAWKNAVDAARLVVETFRAIVTAAFQAVQTTVSAVVNAVAGFLRGAWAGAVDLGRTVVETFRTVVSSAFQAVQSIATSVVNAVASILRGAWSTTVKLAGTVVDAWRGIVDTALRAIGSIITNTVNTVTGLIRGAWSTAMNLAGKVTQTLRQLIDAAWQGIRTIISSVVSVVGSLIRGDWRGAMTAAGTAVQAARSVIDAAWQAIRSITTAAVQAVMSLIRGTWTSATQLMASTMQTARAAVASISQQIRTAIQQMATAVLGFIRGTWSTATRLAASTMQTARQQIGASAQGVRTIIQGMVSFVTGLIRGAWSAGMRAGSAAAQAFQRAVASSMQAIRGAVNAMWNGVRGTLNTLANTVQSKMPAAFRSGVNAMSAAWNRLKAAAEQPVRFVVSVVNRGLIRPFNKLAGAFGVGGVGEIGYASGGCVHDHGDHAGHVPGFSAHDRADNILARLTAGEFVLPVKAVERLKRMVGLSGLETMRQGRMPVPKFADGGHVGKALNWAKDGLKSAWNGVTGLDISPGALFAGVKKNIVGKIATAMFTKILNAMKEKAKSFTIFDDGGADGASAPGGPVRGWRAMSAWVRNNIPGAVITSALRTGTLGGKSSLRSYHNRGRAVDVAGGPGLGTIFNRLRGAFPNSTELIYSPAGAAQLKHGRSHVYGGKTKRIHYDHVHWAMADGGRVKPVPPTLFDKGGELPPGVSVVQNASGKPERVLTAEQEARLLGRPATQISIGKVQGLDADEVAAKIAKDLARADMIAGVFA